MPGFGRSSSEALTGLLGFSKVYRMMVRMDHPSKYKYVVVGCFRKVDGHRFEDALREVLMA